MTYHLKIVLFAGDAKLYKDLQNLEDFEMIQDDIDKLCKLSRAYVFNVNKCKILHIGKENPILTTKWRVKIEAARILLTAVNCEKDIYIMSNAILNLQAYYRSPDKSAYWKTIDFLSY